MHEAIAHFERTGAIPPGEQARVAAYLARTNGRTDWGDRDGA